MGDGEPWDALIEWDYGDYEGRTTDDIRAERPGWLLWRDGCPGGERPDDVGRRADRVITTLRDATADVILFAHGHILRVLAARWVGLAPAEGSRLALDPATISVLGYERAVDGAHDLAQGDLVRRPGQDVATAHAPLGAHEAGALQSQENLLEVRLG